MGFFSSQQPDNGGLTPEQIQALAAAPNTPPNAAQIAQAVHPGDVAFGNQPSAAAPDTRTQTPLSQAQANAAQFDNPQSTNMWDRLMNAVGQGALPKMPGTTIGAPAGSPGMAQALPPMLPQGQMAPPRGMGAYFQALQNPGASGSGNNSLMAQYMALQQLMRGA